MNQPTLPPPNHPGLAPPTPPGKPRRLFGLSGRVWLGVVAVIVAIPVAFAVVDATEDDRPDAGARLACRHFRNVVGDIADGVLTDAEIRDKVREVDGDASVSDEPGIADGARMLLAAATSGDSVAFGDAAVEFSEVCGNLGL